MFSQKEKPLEKSKFHVLTISIFLIFFKSENSSC